MLNTNFILFPTLKTKRLTLRQLSLNDEHEIFILRSDSEINKYLDRQMSNTVDDARNFINKVNENNLLYWAITFSNKNILIGTICLFSFSEENNKCEIGYELLPDFQRQGIMKEAIEKIIDYAFNIIKVQKIEAVPHKGNNSSINLLEKLSFKNSNEYDKTIPELVCYYLVNEMNAFNKNYH